MSGDKKTRKEFKVNWKSVARRFFLIVLGGFIAAAGINLFLAPFKLLTAGVAGIALLVHYVEPRLATGLLMVLLNIPIFILGWFTIDRRYLFWSLLGMVSLSVFLDLTEPWTRIKPVNDFYLAIISGGLLTGMGVGLTFRAQGSMGGTDILAIIVRKYYSTSIGTAQMSLNGLILAVLALRFSLQSALASAFAIYFEARAIDRTIIGLNQTSALLVITDNPREIGEALMEDLDRGVTYLRGKGGYLREEKDIVYCIMPTRQLSHAKSIVERIDPHSFTTVQATAEVIGKGFRRMPV